jgi:hypothetical protein
MKSLIRLFLLVGLVCLIGACATLSESECLVADWYIIGLEDGAAGRQQSYLGNHRKACASYGTSPNLIDYQAGHSEGLLSFCVRESGFSLGSSGHTYNGVCPDELEHDFIFAYEDGRRLYAARVAVQKITHRINDREREIERIRYEIIKTEKEIISDKKTRQQRIQLLDKTKRLNRYIGRVRMEILSLQRNQLINEIAYKKVLNHVNSQYY